jgi:hypothetical protein
MLFRLPGVLSDVISTDENLAPNHLFDTLARKHVLHESETGGYVSLRRWNKSIKEKHTHALATTLKNASDAFADKIAVEFVTSVQKLLGLEGSKTVVPLPAADFEMGFDFRWMLTKRIAQKLNAKLIHALNFCSTKTKRTTKSNPYSLSQDIEGGVLLLDDFTRSARNIAFAQDILRQSGASCHAMSWIGPA